MELVNNISSLRCKVIIRRKYIYRTMREPKYWQKHWCPILEWIILLSWICSMSHLNCVECFIHESDFSDFQVTHWWSPAREKDHKWITTYILLCSSLKAIVWLQKTWNICMSSMGHFLTLLWLYVSILKLESSNSHLLYYMEQNSHYVL